MNSDSNQNIDGITEKIEEKKKVYTLATTFGELQDQTGKLTST